MDATPRKTISAMMAGRKVEILVPTDGQLAALMMINSDQIADMVKVELITELFLTLLSDDDTKAWFIRQLCLGTYSVEEIATTIGQLGSEPDVPKKTAKKTAARRR